MIAPSVERERPSTELGAVLRALDGATLAADVSSFHDCARALRAIRSELDPDGTPHETTIRTDARGALRLVREALELVEAQHLAPEFRAVIAVLVSEARRALDRLAGHTPVVTRAALAVEG